MVSIVDFAPFKLRPEQEVVLKEIEAGWAAHDVFKIVAPTGFGKSCLMYTIAKWQAHLGQVATIVPPDNAIAEQVHAQHSDIPILRKKSYYHCATGQTDCGTHQRLTDTGPCADCPSKAARLTATESRVRIANTYVYWSYKLYSDVVLFDEGHRLVDMMADKANVVLPVAKYGIPSGLRTCADLVAWLDKRLREKGPDDVLESAHSNLMQIGNSAAAEYYYHSWGKGRPVHKLKVVGDGAKLAKFYLWPQRVKKVVLLSATLADEDLIELGLNHRRVLTVTAPSPIPPSRRPFIPLQAVNMASKYRPFAVPKLAEIIDALLERHKEKGLIHVTYDVAKALAELRTDERLIFHNKKNKAEKLRLFKDSDPTEGKVLVASGLYEGVDLPYDAARWQLIGMVPFVSLGDAGVAEKLKARPEWYDWEAIKKVVQATGRIVRSPDDYGITYCADLQFSRLNAMDKKRGKRLFPQYFLEAIRYDY